MKMSGIIKIRLLSFLLLLSGAFIGVLSRKFSMYLPSFLALYAGDTCWAFSAYFLIKILFPEMKTLFLGIYTYSFSLFIEITQFIHFPLLEKIRSTFLGGLALGFGFHLSDLICYFAGVVLGVICDLWIFQKLKKSSDIRSG